MKRSWRMAALWDAALLGVPLVIAAIVIFNGWPPGNARLLLLVIFTAEVFFLLVPTNMSGTGGWSSGIGGAYGAARTPSFEVIEAAVEERQTDATRAFHLDPAAIGPAVALIALALSLLFQS